MIRIKDSVLGKYHITNDSQGFYVVEDKAKLIKVENLNKALSFVAEKLVLDTDAEYTLLEYTKKREEIFSAIIKAQTEAPLTDKQVEEEIFTNSGTNEG